MWFILAFLLAFRIADEDVGGRFEDVGDIDSVLKDPSDVQDLMDLAESGVSTFDDDLDDFTNTDLDSEVGQPPEVLASYKGGDGGNLDIGGKVKKVDVGPSDTGAKKEVTSMTKYSEDEHPKVMEMVHKGKTEDSAQHQYKMLKPLKIPYSQLPEHLRPADWMKDYKLVPKEKPTERPDYKSLNFETPITTHDPTPDRVVHVDGRNPAFYTRPPTAAPPPRPIVHMLQHVYKVKPDQDLINVLKGPQGHAKTSLLPEKFMKYLRSMSESRRKKFMDALEKANKNSRKLFLSILQKIIAVSESRMQDYANRADGMEDTLKELEENMEKQMDTFTEEAKTKYDTKISKTNADVVAMQASQKRVQKHVAGSIVDLKEELHAEMEQQRKIQAQDAAQARTDMTKMADSMNKLKKENEKLAKGEKRLLEKLNRLRTRQGKSAITALRTDGADGLHIFLGDSAPAVNYRCGSCRNDKCRQVCHRCNGCQTDQCRNVCRCGVTYRKNLRRLKVKIGKLKSGGWDDRKKDSQRKVIKILRAKLRRFRNQFKKALLSGKTAGSKNGKNGKGFRIIMFGSWGKRSHRRLYRYLEERGVDSKVKRKVVRIFHQYYHRAMRHSSKWRDSPENLTKYLSTVTRVWTKKARRLIEKSQKKNGSSGKVKGNDSKVEKAPKVKKIPPPIKRDDNEKPYAEKLYNAWLARSEHFIHVHFEAVPAEKKQDVLQYMDRMLDLARRKYVSYLSRDYPVGSRYIRRKQLLDWFVDLSEAMHTYMMKAVLGDAYKPKSKAGYLSPVWDKWLQKSRHFMKTGLHKLECKASATKYIEDMFDKAGKMKNNYEANEATRETRMKFLKYLVTVSKQLRAKVKYFQKTCKDPTGSRPYVTKMYKRWTRMSNDFIQTTGKRLCKDKYRAKIALFWKQMSRKASKKYYRFLKSEVTSLKADRLAASHSQTAVGFGEEEEEEVGEENSFLLYLKGETRRLERKVHEYLRLCGFTIVPTKESDPKIKAIRRKYKKKMERLMNKDKPKEGRVDKDKTYGITLGLGNGGNPNNIGIGVEDLQKDKRGKAIYTPWKFNKDTDWKRNSYDVGLSFGKSRRRRRT